MLQSQHIDFNRMHLFYCVFVCGFVCVLTLTNRTGHYTEADVSKVSHSVLKSKSNAMVKVNVLSNQSIWLIFNSFATLSTFDFASLFNNQAAANGIYDQ